MMRALPSKSDPCSLKSNSPYEQDAYDYSGRTGPVYLPGALTGSVATILLIGQSQSTNVGTTAHTVTNTGHLFNLSLDNGALYQAKDPLLSCSKSGANLLTILGDSLITGGHYNNVVLLPIGIGSSPIAAWRSDLNGVLAYRIGAAAKRLASVKVSATHVLWMQGESDNQAGTAQATYQAGLLNVRQQLTDAGVSAPMWVALETWYAGATSAAVRAAQAAVVDGSTILQGPDFDTLNATYRGGGNTDFNDSGVSQAASMWGSLAGIWA